MVDEVAALTAAVGAWAMDLYWRTGERPAAMVLVGAELFTDLRRAAGLMPSGAVAFSGPGGDLAVRMPGGERARVMQLVGLPGRRWLLVRDTGVFGGWGSGDPVRFSA